MHILNIDRNKSTLQTSGKVAGAFARTLETFQGTHILGASRGRLCDSKAFLFMEQVSEIIVIVQFLGQRLKIEFTVLHNSQTQNGL